jgi:hypothetical protein
MTIMHMKRCGSELQIRITRTWDWRCGSSSRLPALQVRSLDLNPNSTKKKKKNQEEMVPHPLGWPKGKTVKTTVGESRELLRRQ